MPARTCLLASAASLLVVLAQNAHPPALAQSAAHDAALSGIVSSTEEGAMEGVLVTVRQAGSKRATTVVSGRDGRYQFPRARLEPGSYGVAIRAIGYDLASEPSVSVGAAGTTTANLTLRKTRNLGAQLTNSEWLASFPGTDQQRASVRGCAHCHTMELVTRSKHDAESFTKVVERMAGYPPLAFPLMPQRTPAPRVGVGAVSRDQQLQTWRRQAEYLEYPEPGHRHRLELRAQDVPAAERRRHARDLHRIRPARPHAAASRRDRGLVRHRLVRGVRRADHRQDGSRHRQGHRVPVPTLKPAAPKGILGMRFDEDENLWLGMQFQGGVAKFDTKTEKFQVWSLPPHLNGDHVQVNQVGPGRHKVDGKVWLQDAGTYTILRLDVKTGAFEVFAPYRSRAPTCTTSCPTRTTTGGICRSAPRRSAGSTPRPAPSRCSRRRRRVPGRGAA